MGFSRNLSDFAQRKKSIVLHSSSSSMVTSVVVVVEVEDVSAVTDVSFCSLAALSLFDPSLDADATKVDFGPKDLHLIQESKDARVLCMSVSPDAVH